MSKICKIIKMNKGALVELARSTSTTSLPTVPYCVVYRHDTYPITPSNNCIGILPEGVQWRDGEAPHGAMLQRRPDGTRTFVTSNARMRNAKENRRNRRNKAERRHLEGIPGR